MAHKSQEPRYQRTRPGFKRMEVTALKDDAKLLRHLAKILVDGGKEADAIRRIIDESVKKPISFKEWLEEPLEE